MSRKLVKPAFAYGNLKKFIPSYISAANALVERLREFADTGKAIDFSEPIVRATTDIAGETILQHEFKSLDLWQPKFIEKNESGEGRELIATKAELNSQTSTQTNNNPLDSDNNPDAKPTFDLLENIEILIKSFGLDWTTIFKLIPGFKNRMLFSKERTARVARNAIRRHLECVIDRHISLISESTTSNGEKEELLKEQPTHMHDSSHSNHNPDPTLTPQRASSPSSNDKPNPASTRSDSKSVIDLLINEHLEDQSFLSYKNVRDHCITFILAGSDTSAEAIQWTLYLLAQHPEVAQTVVDEISSVLKEKNESQEECFPGNEPEISVEDISKMHYLSWTIKESLRVLPPVPFVLRVAEEDNYVGEGKYFIPKGTCMIVSTTVMHNHPKLWENGEEFDPLRWSPERRLNRPPFSFVPFLHGPRNCIGHRFAMLEMKVILIKLLMNFRFEVLEGATIKRRLVI
eukprot:CAMPEP_0174275758 /NCGR_PEP_ID=MMETSP0439-20130205/60004_1 /TAXON_ID=0 /ORGANISM="Stereomyxa ramosa, Strain Chinc5" /LENGTH=460 /DNA_ID=CAMNT_0015367901 /DNA_START=1048 /DNA_END=2427 /DNA_ORIENTATION=-